MNGKKIKVSGLRRNARIMSLNVLYLVDAADLSIGHAINIVYFNDNHYPHPLKAFSSILITGTLQNITTIDEIIQSYLENWTIDRMAAVDRNIIRIATYEMIAFPQTPINVIINEAIEIAKEYSTKDSGRFVNGLLDKIKKIRNDSNLMKKFSISDNVAKYGSLQLKETKTSTNNNHTS